MANALELKALSKNYGKIQALSDVSCTLSDGIYALLGPNGSGKSTMMKTIVGLLPPTSGEIIYNSEQTAKLGGAYREKLGYMPQYSAAYPSFSVMDFMLYMSELKELPKNNRDEIRYLLRRVELDDVADRKISALSGGMKQRLSLATAVLGSPKILILDEPTAGLDPAQRIAVRNFISEISADKIVIWATHIVSDIESIAKSVMVLKKGNLIAERSPLTLCESIVGSVWEMICDVQNAAEVRATYRVCSESNENGKVRIRLLSAKAPSEQAVCVTPSLEDYYLSVFGDML